MDSVSIRKLISEFIILILICSLVIVFYGSIYSISKHQSTLDLQLVEWQQISTITLGMLGIVLGYLYFKFKINLDHLNGKKERIHTKKTFND